MLNNIKITDITKTKKGFNALFSDEQFLFSVDDVVLYRNNIQIGSCFTRQELACISRQSQDAKAVDKAYVLLSSRMHSKKELYDKLLRKFEPESARYAVNKMEELSLVDDGKTAEQVVSRCISKGYGIARAKQALYEKRIPKEYWDDALADYPDQMDAVMEYLRGRLSADSDEKQMHKAIDALIRRGHSYIVIRKALSQLSFDTDELPEG